MWQEWFCLGMQTFALEFILRSLPDSTAKRCIYATPWTSQQEYAKAKAQSSINLLGILA
jgi:hypothetical protein